MQLLQGTHSRKKKQREENKIEVKEHNHFPLTGEGGFFDGKRKFEGRPMKGGGGGTTGRERSGALGEEDEWDVPFAKNPSKTCQK